MTQGGMRFGKRMEEIESLLVTAERIMPAPTLEVTRRIVSLVLEVHRDALAELVGALDAEASDTLGALSRVDPVHSVLSLHELHPEALEVRARRAIRVADEVGGKGGVLELVSVEGATIHVRVLAKDEAGASHFERLARKALEQHAPEAEPSFVRPDFPDKGLIPAERLTSRTAEGAP